MARYIDADALYQKLYPLDLVDKRKYTINAKAVADAIANIPTADVAPKSEVARGIFEEIENVINDELQNNCKVLPQFEFSNELWNKVSGRIEALKEICDFIAELKKKYTEGEG